jgi:CheY-like chemotaxis protein
VLLACNGAEALTIVHQYSGAIDLLLTDVVMPGIDGRDLAKQVATIRPTIRVLYSSGYVPNTIAGRSADLGGTLLPKPYPPLTLLRTVREVLDGQAVRLGP